MRAKRDSELTWLRKIGNPSSRDNLVMTSPYHRPSSVQTLGEGEGRLDKNHFTLLKSYQHSHEIFHNKNGIIE